MSSVFPSVLLTKEVVVTSFSVLWDGERSVTGSNNDSVLSWGIWDGRGNEVVDLNTMLSSWVHH